MQFVKKAFFQKPPFKVLRFYSTIMTTTNQPSMVSGNFHIVQKELPEGFTMVQEGTAKILYSSDVFYNKVQVVNRDLSILAIKMYDEMRRKENPKAEDLVILEALSATGLRAIRYWKEIKGIKQIIANDFSEDAVKAIQRNVEYNDISTKCIVPNHADAIDLMYSHRKPEKQFDIIDLDPYGGAHIFMDAAVQSVKDGGLLCVTCTDMATLAGSQPDACFAKYGSVPSKMKACHEQALRIVLASLQQKAATYGRVIVPLLSCSIDFYVRLFVRVFTSKAEVKKLWSKMALVHQCGGCVSFHLQPFASEENNKHAPMTNDKTCEHCGSKYKTGGPIWSKAIHDQEFVKKCLEHLESNQKLFNAYPRVNGLLTVISNELPDVPLFYSFPALCQNLKAQPPKMIEARSAILNAGYQVSQSHCDANAIKTNAPLDFLFDIVKVHLQRSKVTKKHDPKSIPGKLLAKEIKNKIDFTPRKDAIQGRKAAGVAIFLPNPERNWGPKARAKAKKRKSEEAKLENKEEKDAKTPKME